MSPAPLLTVVIAARNAAGTIARAVRSVRDEAAHIILVDDGSSDETVAKAVEASGHRVTVARRTNGRAEGGPMGATRQFGLDLIATPFGVWLDADDEFLPGRVSRLASALESGADVVADETTLVDGEIGQRLREVALPTWAEGERLPVRLFGRNALPAIGLVGFRTSAWRALGYDETLHGAEDVDIFLRGIAARLRFAWRRTPGARVHVYPGSLSRHRAQQRASYARALRKHSYQDVRTLFAEAACSPVSTARSLASMAMFREEPHEALRFLDEAEAVGDTKTWPLLFMRGAAHLLAGETARALEALDAAEAIMPTAEAANNRGVALAREGRADAARAAFEQSARRRPDYEDVRINLAAGDAAGRVTTHPLRSWDLDAD